MTGSHHNEKGSASLLAIGFVVILLFVAALGLDLWRIVSERRAMAEVVDAAAAAGANGLDIDRYRLGEGMFLDPVLVRQLVAESVASQPESNLLDEVRIVGLDDNQVAVQGRGTFELSLLDMFADGPIEVVVSAQAALASQ